MTDSVALIPRTFEEVSEVAAHLARSKIGLPPSLIGREPEIFMIICAGRELGMAPMAALRSFHLIEVQNQPVIPRLSADAMVAVVRSRKEICRYVRKVEDTPERCTWETWRVGDDEPVRSTWTLQQQRAIGWKQYSNWDKYPQRMLSARAKSFLMRDVYPDVLGGMYSVEEMEDVMDAPPAPSGPAPSRGDVIDAVFTEESVPPRAPAPAAPPADDPEVEIALAAIDDAANEAEIGQIDQSLPPEISERIRTRTLRRRIEVCESEHRLRQLGALVRAADADTKEACREPYALRQQYLRHRGPTASQEGATP